MSVIVAADPASANAVLGSVFAGVGVLAVVLIAALGFLWKHIDSVKTDLRTDIGRVEDVASRRFDKLDVTNEGIRTSVQDISVRLTVFEARDDERARMEVVLGRANRPPSGARGDSYPDDPSSSATPTRNRPAAG